MFFPEDHFKKIVDINLTGLGIVILEVNSVETPRDIMKNDSTVKKGIMESRLISY